MLRKTPGRILAGFFMLLIGVLPGGALLAACQPAPAATVTVLAAASLTGAFGEIGPAFELENPGVRVIFSFAGSQLLAAQINQGAPADVFASANPAQMQAVLAGGRVSTSTVFALNRLVVILPADNPAGVRELQDLARPGLRLTLAAPAVPAGQYTQDFLRRAAASAAFGPAYQTDVLRNVVSYEDNVRQVLARVSLGEADAGIVYTSDVSGAGDVRQLSIPEALNPAGQYPIAVLNDSAQPALARRFVRYALSEAGQRILEKYGFISVVSQP